MRAPAHRGRPAAPEADGQVILDLRHRWADGTTQLVFEPVELLVRLALTPPTARPARLTGAARAIGAVLRRR